MANTKLTRTFGSGGNRVKWTWSGWIKRNRVGYEQVIFCAYENSSNQTQCKFTSADLLYFNDESSGNTNGRIVSNAKYRDTNGWYHMVFVWDKNNSTSADRIKMYVNGERVTSFSDTGNAPSDTSQMNNDSLGRPHEIGVKNSSNDFFDGVMSHIHFCDGYAYLPSDFGETDSTTGEWKIKTSPSVSYGTNGYWILKDGNTVTDSSANSNTWTVAGGTLTKTEDNPSNVFATLNPLIKATGGTPTFGNGNTTYKSTNSGWDSGLSTIMPSSGKWYFEVKPMDNDNTMIGLVDIQRNSEFASGTSTYGYLGYKGMSYQSSSGGTGVVYRDNSNAYTSLAGWSAGNICGVAIDLDNQEMFLHINGTYTNSGNPATRANPYDFSSVVNSGNNVAMGVSSRNNYITYVNFGNGYFLTTAVSSAGTNASGIGIFEYDVPTGYTALSTKGLNL